MSVQSEVDELINWYEVHKPEVRTVVVACRPNTLRKFCRKQRKGPFVYRGREIVPARQPKRKSEQQELSC